MIDSKKKNADNSQEKYGESEQVFQKMALPTNYEEGDGSTR
jgi:hypothetical protein